MSIEKRVQKLLALSKSSNQHEAELALQKANELMIEHQITQAQLIPDHEVSHTEYVEITKQHYIWARRLATSVAYMFDCKTIWNMENRSICFIGEPTNLRLTQDMFWHLFKAWKAICKVDYTRDKPADRQAYRKSHGLGFADSITTRIHDLVYKRKRKVKQSTGKDLVIIEQQKVDEYMKAKFETRTVKSRSLKVKIAGYDKGQTAGDNINLNNPIESPTKRLA